MKHAGEESYELAILDGISVLFTCSRIERETVPEHLNCYDVRHDDDGQGIACEIKPFVLVNHWGTILARQEFPLQEGRYYPKEDLSYPGYSMTLSEYESMSEARITEMVSETAHDMQMNL